MKCQLIASGNLETRSLAEIVWANVDTDNAALITDEFGGYLDISRFMEDQTLNHTVWCVEGNRHTNTVEGFWALLKRGIVGQYHRLSVRRLHRYVDEFCYRHNHRDHPDLFSLTISRGLGA